MPHTGTRTTQHYPLAANSRARRRLLMFGSELDVPDDAPSDPAAPDSPGDSGPSLYVGGENGAQHDVALHQRRGFRAIAHLLAESEPATWVFTGDDVTHGSSHTGGRRTYSEHFAERIRWELRRFPDVVINTGVVGETSAELLENLPRRVLRFRPDVVSVMVGCNDALAGDEGRSRFSRNLAEIIQKLQAEQIIVLLQTPHRLDLEKAASHSDLRVYVRIMRETARRFEVPCVDHWAHWKKVAANGADLKGWLAEDGIHPGSEGHRELARLMFHRLGIFDEASPTCATRSK